MRDTSKLGPIIPQKIRKTLDALPLDKVLGIEATLATKAGANFDSLVALGLVWEYLRLRAPNSTMSPNHHQVRMMALHTLLARGQANAS